jgi:archaeosine-15-forming tRNA-guanine transglycosylase
MSITEHIMTTESVYLEGEQTAEMKHEFLKGDVWAMVGASDAHVTVSLNLASILKHQFKGKPCRVYVADMKVQVKKRRLTSTPT